MLKIFSWLLGHVASVEQRLAIMAEQRLKGRQSVIFSFGLAFADLYLLLLEVTVFVMRFFIILFLDSGQGFDVVFKQRTLVSCPYSYSSYKFTQKKLRTYSTGTLVTMVLAVSIVSMVMNLLFSDKLTGWAQTFNWTQTSWTTGASSTAIANHTANQTNWTRFASSTSNIATTTGGAITLTASSVVAVRHDTGAEFTAGLQLLDTNSYIDSTNGGSLKLAKPFGASCTTDTECSDGSGGVVGGWCKTNICTNPWISSTCTSGLDNPGATLQVMRKDLSGLYQWKITNDAALSPQLVSTQLVADNNVIFNVAPNSYPARQACKAVGGRLPTINELTCINSYRANYSAGGAFLTYYYWSATENGTGWAWTYLMTMSSSSYTKNSSYNVRCVKAQ